MKCELCDKKTNWDSSYGRPSFIVCPMCHGRLTKTIYNLRKYNFSPESSALEIILEIGFARDESKKENRK